MARARERRRRGTGQREHRPRSDDPGGRPPGLTSQFDITVVNVSQDAYNIVLQLNRFNKPPRPGAHYIAAYVGQLYVAGPRDQAYTTSEADWKATTTDERLSDTAQLLHQDVE